MMGKGFRRFIAPAAISLALHAGTVTGIYKIFHTPEAQRPKITSPVFHEEIVKDKPDLGALKAEREKYVAELLSKLKSGEKIQLSSFLIKSQALDANIYFAENGEKGYNEESLKSDYESILKRAGKALRGNWTHEALHEFLHTKVFKAYYYKRGSMLDVLQTGEYNCTSSTQLFSALMGDALGETRHKVVLFDDHLQSFLNGSSIENTKHSWKDAKQKFSGCGLVAPPEIFVAAYLLGNGVEREELPQSLSKLYETRAAWKGCPTKGKKNLPGRAWGNSILPAPGVKSGLEVPKERLPNPRFGAEPEEIVKTARALMAAHLLSRPHNEQDFIKTELNGGEVMLKPVIIPLDADWGKILEEKAFLFSSYKYNSFLPFRRTCNLRSAMISLDAFFEIIDGLTGSSRPDLERYTKKNVCGRFRAAIEKRDYEMMAEYSSFTNCTELSDLLIEAYAPKDGDRNFDWLLSSIATMGVEGNFDFFLRKMQGQGHNVSYFVEYGLVLSDRERACPILKAHNKGQLLPFSSLVAFCGDREETWRQAVEQLEDYPPFEYIDGRTLSFAQIQQLKELVEANKESLRKQPHFLEIARILYEYGEKEKALEYLSEIIEYAKDEEAEYLFDFSVGFPPEFIPYLNSLAGRNKLYVRSITQGILCYGKPKDLPPEAVGFLREIVRDKGEYEGTRVDAAYALVWLGVDPLK